VRNRILLVLILLLPFTGYTQMRPDTSCRANGNRTQHYLGLFLKSDHSELIPTGGLCSFITKLEDKKPSFKSDQDFLRYIFSKTHKTFLRHYTNYCNFSALLNKGVYNCLTGTALYALILDHFDVPYKIIETNYHIFLTIEASSGTIYEATDPVNGFVVSPNEVESRISKYKGLQPSSGTGDKTCYRYNFNFYNTVDMQQLTGLMYYNLSVDAYNNKRFQESITFLEKAAQLYKTQRTEEFSRIILLTLAEGTLTKMEKEVCLKELQSLRKKGLFLASNTGTN
jgi:hypothetical protein